MKATEKSRMQAEMMDSVSCAQKLNQPMRLQTSDAFARAFLATSETAGLVLRGSSSDEAFALVTGACVSLTFQHVAYMRIQSCCITKGY